MTSCAKPLCCLSICCSWRSSLEPRLVISNHALQFGVTQLWSSPKFLLSKGWLTKQNWSHSSEGPMLVHLNATWQCQARPDHIWLTVTGRATLPQRRLRICQVVQRWIPGRATGSMAQHGVVWMVHGELIEKNQEISKTILVEVNAVNAEWMWMLKGIRYTKYINLYNYTISYHLILYYIDLYCITLYQTILSYIIVNCIILH